MRIYSLLYFYTVTRRGSQRFNEVFNLHGSNRSGMELVQGTVGVAFVALAQHMLDFARAECYLS
jgi:hypothetical protein